MNAIQSGGKKKGGEINGMGLPMDKDGVLMPFIV